MKPNLFDILDAWLNRQICKIFPRHRYTCCDKIWKDCDKCEEE